MQQEILKARKNVYETIAGQIEAKAPEFQSLELVKEFCKKKIYKIRYGIKEDI